MKSWPVFGILTEDHSGHPHLVDLRTAAARNHLLERLGDRLADLGPGVMGSRRNRTVRGRVQAAPFRHDQPDRVEESLVLGNVRVHHAGQLCHHVAARVAECRVRLQVVPGVGAVEVHRQIVALHGHLAMDVDVLVPLRILVDVHIRLICPIGPAPHLLFEAPRGVADHVVDRAANRLGAVAGDHLLETFHAELGGAHLSAQVADEGRRAVVRLHEVGDVAALDPLLEDLHRREAHSLRPDVARVDVVAARHGSAGVGVMALDRGDEHHLPLEENRREDVVVGEMTAAVVGIVGDQHIAIVQTVATEEVEREAHR